MKKTGCRSKDVTLKYAHQIRVRFNEVDSMQVVWHGNYVKYFEDGREAFGREFDLTYLDAKKQGFALPIVKMSMDYKFPLRYGEVATIETTYLNTPAAKIMFSYHIKNENGQTVCTGETTQVFTNSEVGEMSLNLPDFYKAWKQKHGLLND